MDEQHEGRLCLQIGFLFHCKKSIRHPILTRTSMGHSRALSTVEGGTFRPPFLLYAKLLDRVSIETGNYERAR